MYLYSRGIAKVKDGHAFISGLRNMISCILTQVVLIFKLVQMQVLLSYNGDELEH